MKEKTISELKDIKSKLWFEINQLSIEKNEIGTLISKKQRILEEANKELKARREKKEIGVSDHAVVRYLERRKGMDIEAIRNEILSDKVRSAINMNASSITIEGSKFIIKEGTVVAVLD